ncbi:MAG TPA: hypothetical protein VG079_05285, partial [Gaiellaceae bacterium]|nr:hypothetical protein [Gaiellaceae bacterium]
MCKPRRTFRYVFVAPHARHEPRSSLHWNFEPGSVERRRNVALAARVRADGPDAILVLGGAVSIRGA